MATVESQDGRAPLVLLRRIFRRLSAELGNLRPNDAIGVIPREGAGPLALAGELHAQPLHVRSDRRRFVLLLLTAWRGRWRRRRPKRRRGGAGRRLLDTPGDHVRRDERLIVFVPVDRVHVLDRSGLVHAHNGPAGSLHEPLDSSFPACAEQSVEVVLYLAIVLWPEKGLFLLGFDVRQHRENVVFDAPRLEKLLRAGVGSRFVAHPPHDDARDPQKSEDRTDHAVAHLDKLALSVGLAQLLQVDPVREHSQGARVIEAPELLVHAGAQGGALLLLQRRRRDEEAADPSPFSQECRGVLFSHQRNRDRVANEPIHLQPTDAVGRDISEVKDAVLIQCLGALPRGLVSVDQAPVG